MSQSSRSIHMLSEVTTQQLEPMKSPSDEEVDYSLDSSKYYLHFSVNLVSN